MQRPPFARPGGGGGDEGGPRMFMDGVHALVYINRVQGVLDDKSNQKKGWKSVIAGGDTRDTRKVKEFHYICTVTTKPKTFPGDVSVTLSPSLLVTILFPLPLIHRVHHVPNTYYINLVTPFMFLSLTLLA